MRRILLVATVAACGGDPVNHLPPEPDAAAPACVLTGPPIATHGGAITADETWATGVHEVTSTVTVSGGTLTIAPCVEVRVAANASIELSPAATALIAQGTADQPIRFVRDDQAMAWGHLSAFAPAMISLAHVTLAGGGTTTADPKAADQLGASLVARGDGTLPHSLAVDTVTIDGSTGLGVFMNGTRFTTGSTALAITGAGLFPIFLGADSANELPEGIYTGNANDAILLQSTGTSAAFEQGRAITGDVTLHDRGVPYRVGMVPASIIVGSATAPGALTVEAGVTLAFAPKTASAISVMSIRNTSAGVASKLVVAGTTAKPAILTSAAAAPVAGDWQGVAVFGIDPATRIDHAVIDFAGGPSATTGVCEGSPGADNSNADSALLISLPLNVTPSEFVTNTAIENSAGAGIYRAWRAADVDFLATNTFVGVAGCLQSNVPDASNLCPTTTCPSE